LLQAYFVTGGSWMLNLNETLLAYDPAEALRDETGNSEVISPAGEKFSVICRAGHSFTNIRIETKIHPSQQWHIRKVGELQTGQEPTS
jgi:hypothetical protein